MKEFVVGDDVAIGKLTVLFRSIRNRILECFERASSPFVDQEERKRLLTFVVVGGGPTSIEFTSELCDFLSEDVAKWYRDLQEDYK